MTKRKNYVRQTAAELDAKLKMYTKNALTAIESHSTSLEDVVELSNFMNQFYHYSARNMAMINSQFEGAYAVGSFDAFSKAGFRVTKGEKAIKILVPVQIKMFEVNGIPKPVSKATSEELAKIKAGLIKTTSIRRYKLGNVFDISQTNAKASDLPKIFPNRHYDFEAPKRSEEIYAALSELASRLQAPFVVDKDRQLGAAKGCFMQYMNGSKTILMNPTNGLGENISTGIHELTHAKLHSLGNPEGIRLSDASKEFQAELTAHIVAKHFGIDTSEETIPYISKWTQNGENIQQKAQLLEEVHETARSIIKDCHGIMDELSLSNEITSDISGKVAENTQKAVDSENLFSVGNVSELNQKISAAKSIKKQAVAAKSNEI